MRIKIKENFGANRRKKKAVCSFSLILLLAMTLAAAFASAQVGIPQPLTTAGYITVAPLLVGVGQEATVNLWVYPTPHDYAQSPAYQGFSGVTVTFMKPDGSKDSFKPLDGTGQYAPGQTESLGTLYFFYGPDTAGDWSVSFTMPEQNITDSSGTVLYTGCTSNTFYFEVQTDPVDAGLLNGYPWSPLPNDNAYWSYPINSNNREWSAISGHWLLYGNTKTRSIHDVTGNSWQPYGSGPNTPHIVWDQEIGAGGLVGGDSGSLSYLPGGPGILAGGFDHGAVIMAGKVFTNLPNTNEFECIDLTTGNVLYTMPGQIHGGLDMPGNAYAQNRNNNSVVLANSFGAAPTSYLFGTDGNIMAGTYTTKWNFYNPYTGTLMQSISNVTASILAPLMAYQLIDGTPLAYGITGDFTSLFAWDMSKVVNNNWPTGITWTRPLSNGGITAIISPSILGVTSDLSTVVVTGAFDGTNQYAGFSTKDGASVWNLTLPYSVGLAFNLVGPDDFVVYYPVDATFKCYSMLNSRLLWTSPRFSSSPWATNFNAYSSESNDNNNLYVMFPDGTIAALSLETGQLVWHNSPTPSTEYVNNAKPYYTGMVLVGGNIYAYAGYSLAYEINPVPREAVLVCINSTTGNTTWTLNGGINPKAAANGYIIGLGEYDGNLYCLGKGTTATTVTIKNDIIAKGASTLIQGTVIDKSPATQDDTAQTLFPNGVPAVADEDMSEWMDYLYMQNATLLNNPPTPKGVTVRLSVVDPNSNCYEIGTVTSDSSGLYKLAWTPEIEGEYTVYATFDGSSSYWGSYATTALGVTAAVATATPEPQQAVPDYTLAIIGSTIAIILAVAIVGLLILRKQK